MIRSYNTKESSYDEIKKALRRPSIEDISVAPQVQKELERMFGQNATPYDAVKKIVSDIAKEGEEKVFHYTKLIDKVDLTPENTYVDSEELEKARLFIDKKTLEYIKVARDRIYDFHKKQLQNSWFSQEKNGNILGHHYLPLDSVACYIPGGRYPLVSTALMSIVPAKVAGVNQIVATTPCNRKGEIDPHVLVAIDEAGATDVLKLGGAQAIAALAYGTEHLPKVDKIVGPGNLFVTLAKKLVFGTVGIDSLAGPSEILIIADDSANPSYVAADMLSQAEHDSEACSMLFTVDKGLIDSVKKCLMEQLSQLSTKKTAQSSLERWGAVVQCENLEEAIELSNMIAPEHLELMIANPQELMSKIRHAGAIFLGPNSSEPLGDYIAGTNHILPTNQTARFSSSLNISQFFRQVELIQISTEGLLEIGPAASHLARLEGLEAHAKAIEIRLNDEGANR